MTDTTTPAPVGKKFWESKTFWVNVLALAGIVVQSQTGTELSPVIQGTFLTIVNVLLRLTTKEPITWN